MRNVLPIALGATLLVAFSGSALAAGDAVKGAELFKATCGICHHMLFGFVDVDQDRVRNLFLLRFRLLRRSFGFLLADERAPIPRHAGQIAIGSREGLRRGRNRLLSQKLADIGRLTP
jgi:hypothetical protein